MKKTTLSIRSGHPCAILSVALMLLCATLRGVYYFGKSLSPLELWVYSVTVTVACLLFAVFVIGFGRSRPRLILIPVALGVFFFIVKAFSFESLVHTVLCVILYTAVLVIFSLTLLGVIPTKRLLYPLFGLPLLYHIFVEDMQLYVLADPPVPFFEWLPELSVLCIMAALLSLSVALEKNS